MLEPSKPIPSSNRSSVNSFMEMEKCCHKPGKSINLKSTISTLFSLANASTSFGFITQGLLFDSIVRDGCCWLAGDWEVCASIRGMQNLRHRPTCKWLFLGVSGLQIGRA